VKTPFNNSIISGPGFINPMASMPAEQFGRSIDPPTGTSSTGGGGAFTPPMWLKKSSSTEILVTDATVNGINPTNIATPIDISGTDSTWSIYLHATLGSDGVPIAVEVLTDDTNSIPSDDSGNSYMRIGSAVVSSSTVSSVSPTLAWSQTFVTCGRDPDDPETTPGTYYWQVA